MIPESHKAIGRKLHSHLENNYGLILDEKKLLWGSVAPDFLPKYKFISHYKDESIYFISAEITNLIIKLSLISDFSSINSVLLKSISYKLGVISHYLTDYTTHPHARRIRCTNKKSMSEHISYEVALNDYLKSTSLDDSCFFLAESQIYSGNILEYKDFFVQNINSIVEEYLQKNIDFKNDLDYSLCINGFVFNSVLEAAQDLSLQPQLQII